MGAGEQQPGVEARAATQVDAFQQNAARLLDRQQPKRQQTGADRDVVGQRQRVAAQDLVSAQGAPEVGQRPPQGSHGVVGVAEQLSRQLSTGGRVIREHDASQDRP